MTDDMTPEQRSMTMGRIRSKGNKSTEVRMIELLEANSISGWQPGEDLFGKPDLIFPDYKVAVFLDGCFWHGCYKCYKAPATNAEYWKQKIKRNRKRDRLVTKRLEEEGWRVLRIWEHALKRPKLVVNRVKKMLAESTSE